jgi:hypothetical protein
MLIEGESTVMPLSGFINGIEVAQLFIVLISLELTFLK